MNDLPSLRCLLEAGAAASSASLLVLRVVRLATGAGAGTTPSSDFRGDIVALLVERDMMEWGGWRSSINVVVGRRVRNRQPMNWKGYLRVGFGLALPGRVSALLCKNTQCLFRLPRSRGVQALSLLSGSSGRHLPWRRPV